MASSEPHAEGVASIVVDRRDANFVRSLIAAAPAFADPNFEADLSAYLRERADLVERWASYSADQRWSPAAYVNGTEAGWYDAGYQDVVNHPDDAAAVADFIHRTAAHLAAKRVDRS